MKKKKMSKKKKIIISLCVGIGVGFAACAVFVIWFVYQFLFGPAPTVSDNPDDYSLLYENRVHSGLMLFPKEISESASDVVFHYYWRDTFGSPTAEIFLSCRYEAEEYNAEVSRITGTHKQIGATDNKVYYDDAENFNYPAYVAVDDRADWEYALLLPDNSTIVYIFSSNMYTKDISFDHDYLPANYTDWERNEICRGFSIYQIQTSTMGTPSATTYYERSINTSYENSHSVVSGKYNFYVYTDQAFDGTETITGCTLWYFDTGSERLSYLDSKEESWEFEDLNGTVYQDIQISDDRNSAIITYEDEEGVHEAVFNIEKRGFE